MAYEIGVMIGFIAVAGFFTYMVANTEEETIFGDIIRYIFTISIFLMLTISLNAAHVMAADNGASEAIKTTLNTSYVVSIWIFFIAVTYLTVVLGVSIYQSKKNRMEEEEDE